MISVLHPLKLQCWQVELFFQWIKQNLRVKTFLGPKYFPGILYGSDMRTKYSADWKKAVSYALRVARDAEKKLIGVAESKCVFHKNMNDCA